MSNLNEKYVVEYSVRGQCTHIHTVREMLETNLRNIATGTSNDYLPVAIVDSQDKALEAADQLEKAIAAKRSA